MNFNFVDNKNTREISILLKKEEVFVYYPSHICSSRIEKWLEESSTILSRGDHCYIIQSKPNIRSKLYYSYPYYLE